MALDIEFVCTANNAKSPIALAVARQYAAENDLDLGLSSTGTMVNLISRSHGSRLIDYLTTFVYEGLRKGILSHEDTRTLISNPRFLLEKLLALEKENRTAYLSEIGLEFNESSRQTVYRKNSQIIACIGEGNYKIVSSLYSSSDHKPTIVPLYNQDFSNVDNWWILTYEEFRIVGNKIKDFTLELLKSL